MLMPPPPPFRADQVKRCYRAYASALMDIQFECRGPKHKAPTPETCLAVALRIIEASAKGERDMSRLKNFGMSGARDHLSQFDPPTVARISKV